MADTMAMLPTPPTKPITLSSELGFSGGEKKMNKKIVEKREKREEYAKPRTGRRG